MTLEDFTQQLSSYGITDEKGPTTVPLYPDGEYFHMCYTPAFSVTWMSTTREWAVSLSGRHGHHEEKGETLGVALDRMAQVLPRGIERYRTRAEELVALTKSKAFSGKISPSF